MGQLSSNSAVGTYAADYNYRANQTKTEKTESTEKKSRVYGRTIGTPELSEKAQKYYEELKAKYSNMDFILVSSDMKEEAERNKGMYASSKELLVLIDEEKITADLAAIRPECDYLIVSMHWGNEYQTAESDYQKRLAQLLCDGGADLIIGTHPHVLQPMKWLEREDGHKTLCAYSLGNFVSNQHKRVTMLGGILEVELLFDEDGTLIETTSAGVVPTVTHYKKGHYTIYPLSEYTDELAAEHGMQGYETPFNMTYLTELSNKILGENAITWEGEHD